MRLNPLLFVLPTFVLLLSSCDLSPTLEAAGDPPPSEILVPPPPAPPEKVFEAESPLPEMEVQVQELQRQIEAERLANDEEKLTVETLDVSENPQPSEPEPLPVAATVATESTDPPPADFSLFYEELAPMGEWFETDEYGYVWQPHIAQSDPDWKPYTMGRWIDSDRGWTWISDEPFGWATYHYGRWALIEDLGWVWVPSDVWAPAWVAWRNSEDRIGWCPMPPETLYSDDFEFGPSIDDDYGISPSLYSFIPAGRFGGPVKPYCEPPSACRAIFPHTINVTQVVVGHSHVHCGGPTRDFVRRFQNRDLDHYVLKCDPIPRHHQDDENHHRPRIDGNGCATIYAPNVRAPWNAQLRPVSCSTKLEKPVVVRRPNWQNAQNVTARFQNGRQHQVAQANQAICTPLGQKVMQRQDLLSKIRNQLLFRSGVLPGPPPRTDKDVADTEARTQSNLDAAQIALRNGNPARTPDARDREGRGDRPHPPLSKPNPNPAREQSRPIPGNSPPRPLTDLDKAANSGNAQNEQPQGRPPEENRAGHDPAEEQRQRLEQEQQLQAALKKQQQRQAEIAKHYPKAPDLARLSGSGDKGTSQKAMSERQRLAQNAKDRQQKSQSNKKQAEANARKRDQEAKDRHQAAEQAAKEVERVKTQASMRANAELQRAATEKAASDQRQRAAAAEAALHANVERQRAAAEKATKDQQQQAAAAKAAKDQQQQVSANAALQANVERQRAAAEKAAKDQQQRAALEAARRADAERQRAATEQAARNQQRAAAERAARERQQANAERQRAAQNQANQHKNNSNNANRNNSNANKNSSNNNNGSSKGKR